MPRTVRVKTFLYAVRMLIPGVEKQPIKVGFSMRPDKRRLAYNSGPYACEWLGVWPGTIQDELAFHMRFIHLNQGLKGEWFLPDDEFILAITKKLTAYQKVLDYSAQRQREKEERDAARAIEDEARMEIVRERAVQILEEYQEERWNLIG